MFASDRILTLDVGAGKIMLGEFSAKNASMPILLRYAVRELNPTTADATFNMASVADTVTELMAESGIKPAPLYAMLSGQQVFPRFVKLPAVTQDRVADMVRYEAEQNLPFPIDEVVWDYQLLGDGSDGELGALIVAAKSESAQDAADCAAFSNLELELVDAMSSALYNSGRFNYPDSDECTMILDIGARSTNVVFIDGNKYFPRNLLIGGNTITNEIARSLGVSVEEAEFIKKEIGFVALGGTYAIVDDERADKVSKIIRNVVTRLHTEIVRTITFFRSQQDGSPPKKILLTGGASLTRHMDTFFREKMGIEVEYLNPFTNVAVDERLNADNDALFLMAASVGLALRKCMKCPIEINLMPPAIAEARQFRRRIPFFGVAALGVIVSLLCWYYYAYKMQHVYTAQNKEVTARLQTVKRDQSEMEKFRTERAEIEKQNSYLASMVASRNGFDAMFKEIDKALFPGMWLVRLETAQPESGGGIDSVTIKVHGYKYELDALVSRGGKSVAERLLDRLGESELFVAAEQDKENTMVVKEHSIESDKLTEIILQLKLTKRLGVISDEWLAGGTEAQQ